MRSLIKTLVLSLAIIIQSIFFYQSAFAVDCLNKVAPRDTSKRPSFLRRTREYLTDRFGRLLSTSQSTSKIDVLTGVEDAPKGWKLYLQKQSLPVEAIIHHPEYGFEPYRIGVRIWVDSDFGNANVNLYLAGRIEISLSSVMNQYIAVRKSSYAQIINEVIEHSNEAASNIEILRTAGVIEITNDGIIILTRRDQEVLVKRASMDVTQQIVEYLEQSHPTASDNDQLISKWSTLNNTRIQIADIIQDKLGVRPQLSEIDIWPNSKGMLDPQQNRPSFYSIYSRNIKGLGKVTLLLGNGEYNKPGLAWIQFRPTNTGDRFPSESQIRTVLGDLAKSIKEIRVNENGTLYVEFNRDVLSNSENIEVVRRIVNAFEQGTFLITKIPSI